MKSRFGPILALGLLAASCPSRDTSIWIRPGSSTAGLVFEFGMRKGHPRAVPVGALRVDRCDAQRATPGVVPPTSQAVWLLDSVPGTDTVLSSIRYGDLPAGYRQVVSAAPLERSECYVVVISGSGMVGFETGPEGQVVELDPSELHRRIVP